MTIQELYHLYKQHRLVCTDTRDVREGSIFFALKGARFDGNAFALKAIETGASYAVVDDPLVKGDNFIHVNDTLETLQSLANYHRRHFNIPCIGITGSNGKTTTKELVATGLACRYKVHATIGNFNNHIGVPLTLLSMHDDTEIAVIEMGANHIGEIKALCTIAMPTHGLITSIGKAHLEGFGSVEGVRIAKGELFDYLKENNGFAFVNMDDPAIADLSTNLIEKSTYGFDQNLNPALEFIYKADITNNGFILTEDNTNVVIRSSMFGEYNASNMAAAYTVAMHFNVDKDKVIEHLAAFVPGSNRSELITHLGCTIIKDAYNANPSSMELALKAFSDRYKDGWVILGDMKELGTESGVLHQHIVELVGQLGFENVILVGDEFERAIAKTKFTQKNLFKTAKNIEEVKNNWDWNVCRNKAVLLKGSRSMHLEKLLEE